MRPHPSPLHAAPLLLNGSWVRKPDFSHELLPRLLPRDFRGLFASLGGPLALEWNLKDVVR